MTGCEKTGGAEDAHGSPQYVFCVCKEAPTRPTAMSQTGLKGSSSAPSWVAGGKSFESSGRELCTPFSATAGGNSFGQSGLGLLHCHHPVQQTNRRWLVELRQRTDGPTQNQWGGTSVIAWDVELIGRAWGKR